MIAAKNGHVDLTKELLATGAQKAGTLTGVRDMHRSAVWRHCLLLSGSSEQLWQGPWAFVARESYISWMS